MPGLHILVSGSALLAALARRRMSLTSCQPPERLARLACATLLVRLTDLGELSSRQAASLLGITRREFLDLPGAYHSSRTSLHTPRRAPRPARADLRIPLRGRSAGADDADADLPPLVRAGCPAAQDLHRADRRALS